MSQEFITICGARENNLMCYLFMAIHYPKPEYRNDLVLYTQRVGAALRAQPGLLQLADFDDAANGRIVAVSIWESAEHFRAAREKAFASLDDEPLYDSVGDSATRSVHGRGT